MARWRVVIADDQSIARAGIRLVAESVGDIEVVGEAASGSEALRLCRDLNPNLVLMDLDMPEMDGITAIRALRAEAPEQTILVISVHEEPERVAEAIQAGAMGFLPKSSSLEQMRKVIRRLGPRDA